MITEDYCSFEVAKQLKEKGFDEPCTELNKLCLRDGEKPVLKVTHQKAMKWLRETGIIIEILHVTSKPSNDGWFYSYQKNNDSEANLIEYPSYEEAVEAALKYALKNLI